MERVVRPMPSASQAAHVHIRLRHLVYCLISSFPGLGRCAEPEMNQPSQHIKPPQKLAKLRPSQPTTNLRALCQPSHPPLRERLPAFTRDGTGDAFMAALSRKSSPRPEDPGKTLPKGTRKVGRGKEEGSVPRAGTPSRRASRCSATVDVFGACRAWSSASSRGGTCGQTRAASQPPHPEPWHVIVQTQFLSLHRELSLDITSRGWRSAAGGAQGVSEDPARPPLEAEPHRSQRTFVSQPGGCLGSVF